MEVTEALVAAAWAREQDPVAQLITIQADGEATPVRATDWPGGVTSNGVDYPYYPFELAWAAASRETPFGHGRLTVANVDRRIEEACLLSAAPPTVNLALVRVDDPDLREKVINGARIPSVEGDSTRVSAIIRPRDFTEEPACARMYTPATTPGMF